ncbi:DNA gyrase subunit A [Candidatus Margulisiibacteriota bacterium]
MPKKKKPGKGTQKPKKAKGSEKKPEKQKPLPKITGADIGNVKLVNIEDEMKTAYINYAMSVIVGRALPDVRDGLKPVHRRILFSMYEQGLTADKPFKKSARVVGDVLGKYHPHGDQAIYDSLVRMAQGFSLRYPLVQGQGNYGSVDGDNAAAMRYTEARMAKIAMDMVIDIEKDTVDYAPNFDDTLEEPTVFPAKLPNLLMNGSAGIAVGMATNIPPHNVNELVDGVVALIDKPKMTTQELMEHIQAPDFPTGGLICGTKGVVEAYETGHGSVVMRAVAAIEEAPRKKDRQCIIIKEIPYQVGKSDLILRIADLVKNKKVTDISDIRDESSKDGMRIYIELKRGGNAKIVLNKLYKLTPMQTNFNVNLLALVDGKPEVCTLKKMLEEFLKHRENVIVRRTKFELKKAEDRSHILEGLLIALKSIDAVIKLIKSAKTVDDARSGLMKKFKLTRIQAQAILDMRLQRLTALETQKVKDEHVELQKKIKEYKEILGSRKKVLSIIKKELKEINEKYGDERKSKITKPAEKMNIEDLIPDQDVAIMITQQGFIKRTPVETFRSQRRGGRGVTAMGTYEEDAIENMYVTSTHSYILFFTDKGKLFGIKVYNIPETGRSSKGQSIAHLLNLGNDEQITAAVCIENFEEGQSLIMATQKGIIKKTQVSSFASLRKGGVQAIKLDNDDQLLWAKKTSGKEDIILATNSGIGIRFNEKDVRDMGRTARGVRGISLGKGDFVVSMDIIEDKEDQILVVSKAGYGKRIDTNEFRCQGRGGKGVRTMTLREKDKKDGVARLRVVGSKDDIMIITKNGILSRQKVKKIPKQGRAAKGVWVQRCDKGDEVVSIALVIEEEQEEKA